MEAVFLKYILFIVLILQMRKLKFREVKEVTEQIRNRAGILNPDKSSLHKDEKLETNFCLKL